MVDKLITRPLSIASPSLSHFSMPFPVFPPPKYILCTYIFGSGCESGEIQTQTVILKLPLPLLISNKVFILQDLSEPPFPLE